MPNLPPKPREGERCNGCGICCAVEVCTIGKAAFPGAPAPCPALKLAPDGSRTYCLIVQVEAESGRPTILADALGVGKGCDSDAAAGTTLIYERPAT